MTQLEIALKLREQIKAEWPYVSTILALYENNKDGIFTERVQSMVSKLLPDEVFYICDDKWFRKDMPLTIESILKRGLHSKDDSNIKSLPINVVLFATEDNPLGILK
jgi:hypothetical protein